MNEHIIFTPLETTLILPFSLIIRKFLYISLSGFSFKPNINLSFPFRSLLWLFIFKISKIHPENRQFLKIHFQLLLPPKFTHSFDLRKMRFTKMSKLWFIIPASNMILYSITLIYISIHRLLNTAHAYFLLLFHIQKLTHWNTFLLKINRWQHGDTFNTYQAQ